MRLALRSVGLALGLVVLGGAATHSPAFAAPKAEAEKTYRLADVMPHYDKFLELKPEERDSFRLLYRLKSKNGGPLPKVTLQSASGPIPLPLTPDNALAVPEALYRENPVLVVEGPRGQMSLSLTMEPVLPPVLDLPVELIKESMTETNKAISKYAGAAALFAPKMQGITLKLPANAAAPSVRNKDGSLVALKADKEGLFEFRPSKFRKAEAVVLSASPLKVEFVD